MTIPDTARFHADMLAVYLHTAVRSRSAEVLLAMLQSEFTLHRKIALHLTRAATLESRSRTVARVSDDAELTPHDVCEVLLRLLPDGKFTLIMDCTNLGRTDTHEDACPQVALWAAEHSGAGRTLRAHGDPIPLVWSILPHQGNSCAAARILLVARLLKVLPACRWTVVIADREFVGREWCSFLRWKRIRQCIRIRENTRIVASDLPVLDVLNTCQLMWAIESAFSALKARWLRGRGHAHDGCRANLSALWAAVSRTGLDDADRRAAGGDPRPSAG